MQLESDFKSLYSPQSDCKSAWTSLSFAGRTFSTPRMFCRICNPAAINIRIYNPIKSLLSMIYAAWIGFQILIFPSGGLQIRLNILVICRLNILVICCLNILNAKNVLPDLQSGSNKYKDFSSDTDIVTNALCSSHHIAHPNIPLSRIANPPEHPCHLPPEHP